jgi:hypothetical protein
MRRGQSLRARAAFGAVLLSISLLVMHMARLGHMLLVSHEVCEHGALVHAHHDETARHADPAAAPHGGRALETCAAPGTPASDAGHEHCDPFSLKAISLAVSVPGVTPRLLDGELLPWSVRPSQGEQIIAILSLAPKNSPPA